PPLVRLPEGFERSLVLKVNSSRRIEIPFVASPKPKLTWKVNGEHVLRSTTKASSTVSVAILELVKVQLEDTGDYILTLENDNGAADLAIHVRVIDKPSPPENFQHSDVDDSSVTLSWSPPSQDGGEAITKYHIERKDANSTVWLSVDSIPADSETRYCVKKLIKGKAYSFRVSAENSVGVSEPTNLKEAVTIGSPYKVPGPPVDLLAKTISTTALLMHWEKPKEDGGKPIVGYLVEWKLSSSSSWNSPQKVIQKELSIEKLKEDTSYSVRVKAFNDVGEGPTCAPVVVSTKPAPKPPGAPGKPDVTSVSKDGIAIKWTPPEKDGGSPIVSYSIQRRANDLDNWTVIKTDVKSPDYSDFDVKEGQHFQYQVTAVNVVGEGPPSLPSDLAHCLADLTLIRPLANQKLTSMPKQVSLECELSQPNCKVSWQKDGKPVSIGGRFDMSLDGKVYKLVIRDFCVEDVGQYSMTYQHISTTGNVELAISPNVKLDENFNQTVKLKSGESKVFEIPFEAYPKPVVKWTHNDAALPDAKRFNVDTIFGLTSLALAKAKKTDEGKLTVSIENELGKTTFDINLLIIDKPSTPQKLQPVVTTESSITVKWELPLDDGGAPIDGYEVQYRKMNQRAWQEAGTTTDMSMKVGSLVKQADYHFRVAAFNIVGKSDYTETKNPIRAKAEFAAPSLDYNQSLCKQSLKAGVELQIPVLVYGEPQPTVKWTQNGQPLNANVKVQQKESETKLFIARLEPSDSASFTILAENDHGKATAEFQLTVAAVPSTPKNFAVQPQSKSSVVLNWEAPDSDGNSPIIGYEIEKCEQGRDSWVLAANVEPQNFKSVIGNLLSEKVMLFRVAAVNAIGQSPWAAAEPIEVKSPFSPPSAPRNLQVDELTPKSVSLVWKEPKSDGGAPIDGYRVEKYSTKSDQWMPVNQKLVSDTKITIDNLKVDTLELRVLAENEAGISEPSEKVTVDLTKASKEPGPPGKPTVKATQPGEAQVTWKAPEHEGASPVTGYMLEKKNYFETAWIKVNLDQVPQREMTVSEAANEVIQYRAIAVNKHGKSKPSPESDPYKFVEEVQITKPLVDIKVTQLPASATLECEVSKEGVLLNWYKEASEVRISQRVQYEVKGKKHVLKIDNLEPGDIGKYTAAIGDSKTSAELTIESPPEFVLNKDFLKEITIKAGSSKVIEVGYHGCPVPKVSWTFQDLPLAEGNIVTETVYGLTCMRVTKAKRLNAGLYTVALSNEFGNISMSVKLIVLDKPSPPQDLEVREKGDETFLFWQPPKDDGGKPVREYSIEKRDATKKTWQSIGRTKDLQLPVSGLNPGSSYFFRVFAENECGFSEPAETSQPFVTKKKAEAPSEPAAPLVRNVEGTRCTVSWMPPVSDGGSPIAGYHLEKRVDRAARWIRVNKDALVGTEVQLNDLVENSQYEFRVSAENQAGLASPFSAPSRSFTTKEPYDKPEAPRAPEIKQVTKSSAVVAWKEPLKDGGAPITGYNLEYKMVEAYTWIRAKEELILDTNFTLTNLDDSFEYESRVAATNKAGQGPFSQASEHIKLSEPKSESAPSVVKGLESKQTLKSSSVELACSFNVGHPEAEILWYKDGRQIRQGSKYSITIHKGSARLEVPKCRTDDSGKYMCRAENKIGKAETTAQLLVMEKPALEIDAKYSRGVTVKAGSSLSLIVPFSGFPTPSIAWTYNDGSMPLDSRLSQDSKNSMATLSWRELKSNESGRLKITAKNEAGEESFTFEVRVINKPDAPNFVEVKKIVGDKVLLSWTPPTNDGGAPIRSYSIEKRELDKSNWTPAGTATAVDTQCEVRHLAEEVSYTFRVMAENEVGIGDACEIESPIKIEATDQLPGPPLHLKVTDVSSDSATVSWKPPENADQSAVTGYIVQKREGEFGKWLNAVAFPTKKLTMKVDSLTPDETFTFRVIAKNKVGNGEPSQASSAVKTKPLEQSAVQQKRAAVEESAVQKGLVDETIELARQRREQIYGKSRKDEEEEALDVKLLCEESLVVKVNSTLNVPVKVTGAALHEIELIRAGRVIFDRISIDKYGKDFTITLRNAKSDDAGTYTVKASRKGESAQCQFELNVLDVPGRPKGPLDIKVVDEKTLTLSWSAPDSDGGSPIKWYTMEKKDVHRTYWSKQDRTNGANPTITMSNIVPGAEYMFKVIAENQIGQSEPLFGGSTFVMKSPYDKPSRPEGPLECVKVEKNFVDLRWRPPASDGGRPIQFYALEVKEVGSDTYWTEVTTIPAPDVTQRVKNLREGHAYRFRVRACNSEGFSDWLETEKSISVMREPTRPGPPTGPMQIEKVEDNKAKLSWNAPLDDGGTVLIGYRVEVATKDAWQTVENTDVYTTKLTTGKLKEDVPHTFRVFAINKVGESTPLLSGTFIPGAPNTVPGQPLGPLTAKNLTSDSILLNWDAPTHTGGLPVTGYKVEKYDFVKNTWSACLSTRASQTSGTVFGLKPGEKYIFRVSAENEMGRGEPLEMHSSITCSAPFSVPATPLGPVIFSNVTESSLEMSWQPPAEDGGSEIKSYTVQMRYPGSSVWHRVSKVPGSQTSCKVTNLLIGKEYMFRVAATNEAGTGSFLESEAVQMAEHEDDAPPPWSVKVIGKTPTTVTIEWAIPHDCSHGHVLHIDGYMVFLKTAGSSEAAQVASVDHFVTKMTVSNLSSGRLYYFGVAAFNARGIGETCWTQEATEPESVSSVPSPPVGPLTVSDVDSDSCILSWKRSADDGGAPITGYRVFKREVFRRSWQEIGKVSPTTLAFEVKYLMENVTYDFKICAENKNGLSEPLENSRNILIKKGTSAPSPPQGPLKLRELTKSQVLLSWKEPINLGGLKLSKYIVEMKDDKGHSWRTVCETTDTEALVDGIKPDVGYNFKVFAENSEGRSMPLISDHIYMQRSQREAPKAFDFKMDENSCSLDLFWQPVSSTDVLGYKIERIDLDSASMSWNQVDFVQPGVQNLSVYSSLPGIPYKYRILAVYPHGTSMPVELSHTICFAQKEKPAPVEKFAITDIGDRHIDLAWKAPPEESVKGYRLEIEEPSRKYWQPIADLPKDVTKFSVTNISTREPQTFRIFSVGERERGIPLDVSTRPLFEGPQRSFNLSEMRGAELSVLGYSAKYSGLERQRDLGLEKRVLPYSGTAFFSGRPSDEPISDVDRSHIEKSWLPYNQSEYISTSSAFDARLDADVMRRHTTDGEPSSTFESEADYAARVSKQGLLKGVLNYTGQEYFTGESTFDANKTLQEHRMNKRMKDALKRPKEKPIPEDVPSLSVRDYVGKDKETSIKEFDEPIEFPRNKAPDYAPTPSSFTRSEPLGASASPTKSKDYLRTDQSIESDVPLYRDYILAPRSGAEQKSELETLMERSSRPQDEMEEKWGAGDVFVPPKRVFEDAEFDYQFERRRLPESVDQTYYGDRQTTPSSGRWSYRSSSAYAMGEVRPDVPVSPMKVRDFTRPREKPEMRRSVSVERAESPYQRAIEATISHSRRSFSPSPRHPALRDSISPVFQRFDRDVRTPFFQQDVRRRYTDADEYNFRDIEYPSYDYTYRPVIVSEIDSHLSVRRKNYLTDLEHDTSLDFIDLRPSQRDHAPLFEGAERDSEDYFLSRKSPRLSEVDIDDLSGRKSVRISNYDTIIPFRRSSKGEVLTDLAPYRKLVTRDSHSQLIDIEMPTRLVPTEIDKSSVLLTWRRPIDVTNLSSYRLEEWNSKDKTWKELASLTPRTTEYRVAKLEPERDYLFRIIAEDIHGRYSAPVTLDRAVRPLVEAQVPAKPWGLTIRLNQDRVESEWFKPFHDGGAPIQAYRLELEDVKKRTRVQLDDIDSFRTRYFLSNLDDQGQYRLHLYAVNRVGTSEPVTSDIFVPRRPVVKPPPPTGPLKVIEVTDDA
uniref:TITIN protein n=1 Tax=Macrostomum lignano TaxID=282301 RepID=A0A1I8JGU5_9PLAT